MFAVALVALTFATLVASAGPSTPGHVRAVITFVGDSNETLSATAIQLSVGDGDEPYADVFLALPGAGVRGRLCGSRGNCSAPDIWKRRISEASEQISSDGFVVNLGINDTLAPGTANGLGYSRYGDKIDWIMAQFGNKPVWWTNLPCSIEPPNRAEGCRAINTALAAARSRWTNLKVLDWAAAARGHREYLLDGANRVHQSSAGQSKWAGLVEHALNQRFPA